MITKDIHSNKETVNDALYLLDLALKEAKREDTFRRILETDLNINLFLERTVS